MASILPLTLDGVSLVAAGARIFTAPQIAEGRAFVRGELAW